MFVTPLGRRYSLMCPGISDIADYLYSNPTLLDLKVQGLWLASRMVLQHLFSVVLMTTQL